MVNVSGTGTETLPSCKTFGLAIVVGLVKRAKTLRRILVRTLC